MNRDPFDRIRERMKAASSSADAVDPGVLASEPYSYSGKRAITVEIVQPEFTSVCPMTGLPDHGVVTITYVPSDRIVELQSLKFYLMQYRNVGVFYEHAVNRILDDLIALLAPEHMIVTIAYTPRGGITTTVTAEHRCN